MFAAGSTAVVISAGFDFETSIFPDTNPLMGVRTIKRSAACGNSGVKQSSNICHELTPEGYMSIAKFGVKKRPPELCNFSVLAISFTMAIV